MDEHVYEALLRLERSHWWFVARRQILLDLTRRFVPPGSRLLDVGCGTGYYLEAARREFDAYGIDFSDTAVRMCRERGLTNVTTDTLEDLAQKGAPPFQAVTFLDVIEHLDDDIAALRFSRAVLAHGGVVIVTVPAYQFLWSAHDNDIHHRRRYVARDLRARLETAGFRIELLTYFNTLLFPLALGRRLLQRLIRRASYDELALPPAWLNRLLLKVFATESHWVRGSGRGVALPFGLSVAAVGRVVG